MKLALMREQTAGSIFSLVPLRIGSGVVFKLRATLEPTQEESRLLDMYDLARAPLVTGDTVEDLRRGFRQALVLGGDCFFCRAVFHNRSCRLDHFGSCLVRHDACLLLA